VKRRAKSKKGGLCLYLKKKHHWSEVKYKKCVTNSNKKHRGRKRHSKTANPWAICYSQGLKKGTAKYERCVMKVKRKR